MIMVDVNVIMPDVNVIMPDVNVIIIIIIIHFI